MKKLVNAIELKIQLSTELPHEELHDEAKAIVDLLYDDLADLEEATVMSVEYKLGRGTYEEIENTH